MAASVFSQKSLFIITGASRGLGRSIALQFSNKAIPGSLFILLARNEGLLKEVADLILHRDGIKAVSAAFDQSSSRQDDFENLIENCMSKANALPNDFGQAVLIHNAGTLEPIDFVRDLDKTAIVSSYLQTNVVGFVVLTSKFLQLFKPDLVASRVVINISSLAAVSPINTWGLYCMGKAARDMMIQVLASEEKGSVRALNYAPGPLQTDMNNTALQNSKDPELKKMLEGLIANKTYVECDDSVKKLLSILEENSFENGSHIDFYDK